MRDDARARVGPGTYRFTLTHEQTGKVAFDHAGMAADKVDEVMQLILEMWPAVQATRGAAQAFAGIQQALEGLQGLGVVPRRKHTSRGRR